MPKKRKPKYALHRASGQARVRIDGKDHYLGEYDSPESHDRYEELVGAWLRKQPTDRIGLRVDDLCLMFIDWADENYRHPDGTSTGEPQNLRDAIRFLVASHGRVRVKDFGPLKLKAVRDSMIDAGIVRTNINRQIHRIKRVFSWGVENECVDVAVYQSLCTVRALQEGRTRAVESDPVQPADEHDITAALPHMPASVAAMVRLQLLTGARPGEICMMRPRDVTLGTDGVWCYRPGRHKTSHRGKDRRIFIGPEGQEILRPYLDRDPDAFCFDPRDATRCRAKLHRYTKDSYAKAVRRACKRAMPEAIAEDDSAAAEWLREHAWSPGQLRHTRATVIREQYGLEAAQLVLGHAKTDMTEVYAEKDFSVASAVMREIG